MERVLTTSWVQDLGLTYYMTLSKKSFHPSILDAKKKKDNLALSTIEGYYEKHLKRTTW